jgi:uncharacterized protein with HEPN domain
MPVHCVDKLLNLRGGTDIRVCVSASNLLRNASQRLKDILENIEAIQTFVARMDFAKFAADWKTVYAVTHALIKERHPQIDWTAVAAAGNVYRHEYEAVDDTQVWNTV